MVQLLASTAAHQVDLSNRVVAFQKASDALSELGDQIKLQADTFAKEISPTIRLSEGMGTVLDGPGKYMHDHGLDEDWKSMQEEARELNDAIGTPPSSQTRTWNFS